MKKILAALGIGLCVGLGAYGLMGGFHIGEEEKTPQELPGGAVVEGDGGSVPTEPDTGTEANAAAEGVSKEEKKGEPGISDNVETKSKNQQRTHITDKPVGRIHSDVIRMNEPVYVGASELNMMRGVATVEAGEQLDELTVAIAGHRSYTPYTMFNEVINLREGHEVTVDWTDKKGKEKSTVYVVADWYNVTPSQVEVLKDDKNQTKRKLVLVTCDVYNKELKRYDMRRIVVAYEK